MESPLQLLCRYATGALGAKGCKKKNASVAMTLYRNGRWLVSSCQNVLPLGSQCFLYRCEQLVEKRRTCWKWWDRVVRCRRDCCAP